MWVDGAGMDGWGLTTTLYGMSNNNDVRIAWRQHYDWRQRIDSNCEEAFAFKRQTSWMVANQHFHVKIEPVIALVKLDTISCSCWKRLLAEFETFEAGEMYVQMRYIHRN